MVKDFRRFANGLSIYRGGLSASAVHLFTLVDEN